MAEPNIPAPPPGYVIDPNDPTRAIPAQQAAFGSRPVIHEAPPAPKAPDAPSGYRFRQDGSLEPIPGGPADPNKDQPKVGVSPVSGDAYLKTLDSGTASLVRALAEGRKSFPSGSALRSPYWQEMLTRVSNYDPGFDEVNYTSRSATRRDFTSGKAANNIRALNTAIGHLGHLEEQIGGTASHSLVPVNAVENTILRATGDPGPTNFDATVSALAGELTAVYRGAGGAEADIQRYVQQLNPNASQAQKEGTIRNIVGLLKSRLDALNDQYRQGMGTTAQQLQLLDPQSQLIVQHLGGFDAAGAPDNGSPPAGPAAPGGGTPPTGGAPTLPNDQLTPSTGGTKEVYDSSMTPVRKEYMARLEAGQSGTELVGFLRKAGITDPALLHSAAQQAAFRRQHPNIPVQQYNTAAIDHHVQEMGPVNRAVNAIGQAGGPVTAGIAAAGNSALAGFGPDIVGATGGNPEQARIVLDQLGQQNPAATLTGDIAGGTLAALGGEAALGAAGMAPSFGRSLAADTAYGTATGAGNSPDNRTAGAIEGALAGAGGSVIGQGLAKGASAVARGVTNSDVKSLIANGVESMTPGQIVGNSGRAGQAVKGVEDRLAGFSGVGTMINARRSEGYRQFNSAAFDQALKPIGASVGKATGEEAIAAANDAVSNAFSTALKGKVAVPDQAFVAQARGPLERLANNKRVGPEIVDSIEQATQGLFDDNTGALSGENMQSFLQALRQIREGYRNDPLYQSTIKPSLQGLESAVEGMFQRQAPEVMPAFNKAKAAYRRLSVLADAVDRGKASEGVFTPGQLGMADRANAKRFDGKISAASGQSPFFDLQRSAQNVLPNKVPDSGTAGRLALVGGATGLTGLGAGAGFIGGDTKTGAESGLGLTALLAAVYTKAANRRLAQLLLSRSPAARAIAEKISQRVPIAGAAGTALMLPGPSQ